MFRQSRVRTFDLPPVFQEIDLVTGTLGNIQSGSKKLIGKANPVYALQVHDGLLYAAGPSLDGANVKVFR